MKPIPPPLSDEAQAVIKALRGYLKRAEAGEIPGVCIIAANNDHTYDAEYFGTYEEFPSDAIAPIEILKLKIVRKALDGI